MPGDKPLIPTIRADFPSFGSKLVHPSAKLPEAASGETWFFTIIKWRKAEKGEMKGQKETQQASRASVLMSLYWLISVWLAPTKHLLVLQLELRSIFKEGGVETDRAKSGRGQLMHVNEQAIQEQQRTVEEWTQCLDEIHVRIGPRFARAEQRRRVRVYLQGLLSPLERKNGWQLAEAAGEANPYGMQELLSRAKWDADAIRDDLIDLVKVRLADPQAVLVIDETGFLKKGKKSVGVAPQYSGTAGKVANCQVGVFAAYATRHGQVLLDRALYLPQGWTLNQQRCRQAGVPEQVGFATKLELARRMVERVIAAEVPVAWVTADSTYGADYQLRSWLAAQRIPSVLAVASNHMVRTSWRTGRQAMRVDQFLQQPKRLRWSRLSAGLGAKGPRLYDWAWRTLEDVGPRGWATWIVARRSLAEAKEIAYYYVCAPKHTTLEQIVQVAGQRWKVEEAIERAKSDCGLDQYEVRSWTGWYRHITLAMLSLLGATFMQGQANAGPGKKERGDPFQTGSLQAFKNRRGLSLT